MTQKHRTEYDWLYHEPVNFGRVFGPEDQIDYTETLLAVRERVVQQEEEGGWTEDLDAAFNSILWEEESVEGWANRGEMTVKQAQQDHDLGYRTLKMMAEKGWIHPVFEDGNE